MEASMRSRPRGTDGSDYAFRMTIDDRYKRAAQGKVRLRKFLLAQALFQVLKATFACLRALKGVTPNNLLLASCGCGGTAILLGTLGLKDSSTRLLKFYIFLTAMAVGLSLVPFITGQFLGQWKDSREYFKVTGDYQRVVTSSLEGLQELIGILVQLLAVSVTSALMKNLSPPKKRD